MFMDVVAATNKDWDKLLMPDISFLHFNVTNPTIQSRYFSAIFKYLYDVTHVTSEALNFLQMCNPSLKSNPVSSKT